jgi:hypothetical protein
VSVDYFEAIDEVIERAACIKLPGYRTDIVTIARREFKKRGACDSKFIDPIEEIVRECIREWSPEQKRTIWGSMEIGLQSQEGFGADTADSIDMFLEGELMYHLIEHLAPRPQRNEIGIDDDETSGQQIGWS